MLSTFKLLDYLVIIHRLNKLGAVSVLACGTDPTAGKFATPKPKESKRGTLRTHADTVFVSLIPQRIK